MAIGLAWGIVALGFLAFRLSALAVGLRNVLAGTGAFVDHDGGGVRLTGKRDLFFLYGSQLDTQAGSTSGAEIAHTPTLSLGLVPTKLVQLFVDPCYLSLCSISNYSTGGGAGTNKDFWSLPLVVQLPALVLLPFCVAGLAYLFVRAVRRRLSGSQTRSVPPDGGDDDRRDRHRRRLRREHADGAESSALRVRAGLPASGAALGDRRRRARRRSPSGDSSLGETAARGVSPCSPVRRRSASWLAFLVVGGTAYARTNGLPRIDEPTHHGA